jgi:hypothetical protein
MLADIGAGWWSVYLNAPEPSSSAWTPALLEEYVQHGMDRILLTSVARHGEPPTHAQGQTDGRDALAMAKAFGYTGIFPVCLDVDVATFERAPTRTVEYARAWCATVRRSGARPGVYANPHVLKAMAGRVPAEFTVVATWLGGGTDTPELEYAGSAGGQAYQLLGIEWHVDRMDHLPKPPGE